MPVGKCSAASALTTLTRWSGSSIANRLGDPVHPRVDHDTWKSLLNSVGVRDARLHDARHTAATSLLLKVPDRAVMDIMGWAQVTMTKRYQHITTELTTMIADQVGSLYWSTDESPDPDEGGAAT